MTQDEKLDEALKGTFPASDAFFLLPDRDEVALVEERQIGQKTSKPKDK